MKHCYIKEEDFKAYSDAVKVINNFVADNHHGKITSEGMTHCVDFVLGNEELDNAIVALQKMQEYNR